MPRLGRPSLLACLTADRSGATTLEWALLLGFFLYPTYWIITTLLQTLTSYYGLMTTLNAMPIP